MLEKQAKIVIKCGLLHVFWFGWGLRLVMEIEGLVQDFEPAIDPVICEIEEDVVSWVEERGKETKRRLSIFLVEGI